MTKVEEARRFALESACYTACRDFTPPNSCATNDGTGLWCSMCEDRKNTIAALEQAVREEEREAARKEASELFDAMDAGAKEALRAERVRVLEEVCKWSEVYPVNSKYFQLLDEMLSEARAASEMVGGDTGSGHAAQDQALRETRRTVPPSQAARPPSEEPDAHD